MLESQRGQTMPFWAVAIGLTLAFCFFLINEADILTWQIHAQNAADSAATVGLSPTANVLNQESVLLYATAVDEYRLRYLYQAIINTINGPASGACSPAACASNYTKLVQEYNGAYAAYSNMYQLLQRADNFTEGGQQADEKKVLGALSTFDSAFTYTVLSQPNSGGSKKNARRNIDLIACRTVPYLGAGLLGMNAGASFQAIGRAAANAVPVIDTASPPAGAPSGFSEYFTPSTTDPSTGKAYQPNEDPASTGGNAMDIVDFSHLTVDVNWYGTVAVPATAGKATSYGC